MDEQATTVEKRTGIDVVLNGGKREMNSATIPIKWYLSKEVIEKDPQYIIFFEQNEREADMIENANYGRRYACKVSDAFKYIQLFSPGYHRLMIIAVSDPKNGHGASAKRIAEDYLSKDDDCFNYSLSWPDAEEGILHAIKDTDQIVAVTVEEFEVPEQLFASKPKSKFGKMVWKWVNLAFKEDSKHQCEYRKRKIFAFIVQPPLFAAWMFSKYLIGGTLHALYVLLASLCLFTIGIRPKPLFKEMWRAFSYQRYGLSVKRFTSRDVNFDKDQILFLWSIDKEKKGNERYNHFLPPLGYIVIFFFVYGLFKLITSLSTNAWIITGVVVGILSLSALIALGVRYYLKKTKEKRAEKRRLKNEANLETQKRLRIAKENARKEWLLNNFELSNKRDKVDLNNIPVPNDFTGKVVQKFRVSWWSIKTNVCKPFKS